VIELKNVTKSFEDGKERRVILDNVSLRINEGDFLFIKGRSGSGKTTLLNCIGCLDVFNLGDYYFDSEKVETNDEFTSSLRSKKIGFIFQHFHLLSRFSVLENVLLPTRIAGKIKTDYLNRAIELLSMLEMEDKANALPNTLSGGQSQRVAIARSLINSPRILLADEPTGSLDEDSALIVMDTFKRLNEQGVTIALVSHENVYQRYASRVVEVKSGGLYES